MPYKDPIVRREKGRVYSKKWRIKQADYNDKRKLYPSYLKKYSGPTPEAWRAHREIYVRIKRGELVRPDTCSLCDKKGFIEAAHTSYETREFVWLCRPCHRQMDFMNKKNGTKLIKPKRWSK